MNPHRRASHAFISRLPGHLVVVNPGSKQPAAGFNSPALLDRMRNQPTIDEVFASPSNVGVMLYNGVFDIDIDVKDGRLPFVVALARRFFNDCNHVAGRTSRPATHWFYTTASPHSTSVMEVAQHPQSKAVRNGALRRPSFELRGDHASAAVYTVLPGSTHPSGEEYIWEDPTKAESSPLTFITPDDLIARCVDFAICCRVVEFWQEGTRHELCKALSGGLARASIATMTSGGQTRSFMTQERATFILDSIMVVTDDKDTTERRATLRSTFAKVEKNVPVTGLPTLNKLTGDPAIAADLSRLLYADEQMEKYLEFRDEFVLSRQQRGFVRLPAIERSREEYLFRNQDLLNMYSNRRVMMPGSDKPVSFAQLLIADPHRMEAESVEFDPSVPDRIFDRDGWTWINMWNGIAIEPLPAVTDEVLERVTPFVSHIREIVADGNEEHSHYVVAWFADILQHPASKCGTALVLVGEQGSGKTFISEAVMNPIIGTAHAHSIDSLETITGEFNSTHARSLLITCNEATSIREKRNAARMKSKITESRQYVNTKNIPAFETNSYQRYFMSSNEILDATSISDGEADRRFTVFQVNNRYSKMSLQQLPPDHPDQTYWSRMHRWAADPDNLKAVSTYLHFYEYDRDLIRRPLTTEAKVHIAQASSGLLEQWLERIAITGFPITYDKVDKWYVAVPHGYRMKDSNPQADYFKPLRDKKGRAVVLNTWPQYIQIQALYEEFAAFEKAARAREMTSMSKFIIMLKGLGLTFDNEFSPPGKMVINATYKNLKTDMVVNNTTRLSPLFSRSTLCRALLRALGSNELLEDALKEAEETEALHRAGRSGEVNVFSSVTMGEGKEF